MTPDVRFFFNSEGKVNVSNGNARGILLQDKDRGNGKNLQDLCCSLTMNEEGFL